MVPLISSTTWVIRIRYAIVVLIFRLITTRARLILQVNRLFEKPTMFFFEENLQRIYNQIRMSRLRHEPEVVGHGLAVCIQPRFDTSSVPLRDKSKLIHRIKKLSRRRR